MKEPTPETTSPTQRAIAQRRPFRSRRQECLISLMLTSEALRWEVADRLASAGDLTLQQYNVLRILRGAGAGGLPTLEIAERMIERTPGITRLIDRLEAKRFVDRERSPEDRRQVVCRITKTGLALLARLDPAMDELDDGAFARLTNAEVGQLLALLDKARGDA